MGLFDNDFTDIPIGKHPGSFPACHNSSIQSHDQSRTIKQHVKPIWYEAQAVGPDTVNHLNKSKCLLRNWKKKKVMHRKSSQQE